MSSQSGVVSWSQTAASNATADSAVNWAENQAPSTVNDSARATMASVAKYRDDIAGAIVTGGTATAYTVTSYQSFSAFSVLANQMIAFTPHATSTNAVGVDVTLNVDSLGAKSIRMQPSIALPGGTLVLGTPYVVVYNNSDGVFYLQNMTNPYNVPLGAGMDYWGSSTPNSCFAFPIGQQISQTTYATLYTVFGANRYGADGGGLFYLPDKTGRVSAMKEASATRLTSAGSGITGSTLGSAGGSETVTLAANQIPTITSVNAAQSITVTGPSGHTMSLDGSIVSDAGTGGSGNHVKDATLGTGTFTGSNSISVAYTNNSQVVTRTTPPLIVCNYIIRII